MMVDERRQNRERRAADSLVENARIRVLQDAEKLARIVASDSSMGVGRVRGRISLVEYEGGELTVDELRTLFQARSDIRQLFAEAATPEIRIYLRELAGDEVFIRAAEKAGLSPTEEERRELEKMMAYQLAKIADRLNLSHKLVINPTYELKTESLAFLRQILERAKPTPGLGEFRFVLEKHVPHRVDDNASEAAARLAREQRTSGRERQDG
jgi:hypothetical protein